jgi:hypothetical protein
MAETASPTRKSDQTEAVKPTQTGNRSHMPVATPSVSESSERNTIAGDATTSIKTKTKERTCKARPHPPLGTRRISRSRRARPYFLSEVSTQSTHPRSEQQQRDIDRELKLACHDRSRAGKPGGTQTIAETRARENKTAADDTVRSERMNEKRAVSESALTFSRGTARGFCRSAAGTPAHRLRGPG